VTAKAAVWLRVSAGHQDSDNQVPDVERFAGHHGYEITERYVVSDSAWKNGGGPEYRKTLQRALDDAHAGKFGVLIVWALDRIVREGAEDALRVFRQFRQRGCIVVSVKESWLNSSPEVQDILTRSVFLFVGGVGVAQLADGAGFQVGQGEGVGSVHPRCLRTNGLSRAASSSRTG